MFYLLVFGFSSNRQFIRYNVHGYLFKVVKKGLRVRFELAFQTNENQTQ